MKLYIKNMVCVRCVKLVKYELERLGFLNTVIEMGRVEINEKVSLAKASAIEKVLGELGLELIDDRKAVMVEQVKNAIAELINAEENLTNCNLSNYISKKVNYNYNYLSQNFSETQGITIEKYLIKKKIDRVKELILHHDLSLSQISYKMNYSSVSHLSSQFKKTTGLTPSQYKEQYKT